MLMAKAVEGAATRVEGKRQVAVASFAIALRQLPTILADNAGLDSGELVARLRKAIYDGMTTYGLDLMTPGGGIADMRDLGVIESYKLKRAVVSSASEAAEVCTPGKPRTAKHKSVMTLTITVAPPSRRHHPSGPETAGEDVGHDVYNTRGASIDSGTANECYRSTSTAGFTLLVVRVVQN